MRLTVLGAGAWGTALAMAASARHDTLLWARDPAQAQAMARERCNARYLPGQGFADCLRVSADREAALAHSAGGAAQALTVIATPMAALRETLQAWPDDRPALWLCKGFEQGSGALGHEVARSVRPALACGVLSGPSFAQEVARGQATALVAASEDPALVQAAVTAFHNEVLRVYTSSDLVGVEVGGAVKNVLAIATGILDGLPQAGLNARAALITRGLAEMTRLGLALGARAETFMGLSGMGDLVLTATGDLSRNRRVGLLLAGGQTLEQALQQLGHVAEGVPAAAMVLARAQALGVEMPITEAVVQVLQGRLAPADAIARLMARRARSESGAPAPQPG
jgi:glycerol-3-phosphate dehydrogenase (NAD(P)+)